MDSNVNNIVMLYELFINEFVQNGKFLDVIDKLDYFVYLGINAIQLMSIIGKEYFNE